MNEEGSKSLDVLGLKAYGEAAKVATEGVVNGAEAFLGRICNPAAEELGLLFRDRISHWRAVQASRLTQKAEEKLRAIPGSERWRAHPRLVGKIIESGSWVDADNVQDMWAGLLTSSCSEKGTDEGNLMFIGILSQLTSSQAKVLNFACEKAEKRIYGHDLVTTTSELIVSIPDLIKIAGVDDVNQLDRELDHLRSLGLLQVGISHDDDEGVPSSSVAADLSPTDLGLQMFVRCKGSTQSPAEYFGLKAPAKSL